MTSPAAQLQTLFYTLRTAAANHRRIADRLLDSPRAYDLAEAALAEAGDALVDALSRPLKTGERRSVVVTGGRKIELFPMGCGYTVATRRADGTTEHSHTQPSETAATLAFRSAVVIAATA